MMKQLTLLFLFTFSFASFAQKPMVAPIGGKQISDKLIGIFYEDISMAGDGGLLPELVQNGAFEYSGSEQDGWGPTTAWQLQRLGHSLGWMEHRQENPLNENNLNYIRIHVERVGHYNDFNGWTGVGLQNCGWGGINVYEGKQYCFSVWCRTNDIQPKSLRIALVEPTKKDADPILIADTVISIVSSDWQKYSCVLTATKSFSNAALQLLMQDKGIIDIDQVSLLPVDTYKGHGLRRDMCEAMEALHPRFMRFPGGCLVHSGDGFWNCYRWKNTIGPVEQRKQTKDTWGYHQTMALGYFEYFQLCEDLGAEPLPVLPCGVTCQGAGNGWHIKGTGQLSVPMSEMDEWVEDALDLIEWANGDSTTTWGRVRAEAGHSEPFKLKYIGLGNEEHISSEFEEHFEYMYEKIHSKYPDIQIIGTAGPWANPGNSEYIAGWQLAEKLGAPLIDEHYFKPNSFFQSDRHYDKYPRNHTTKVYLGEYASKDKRFIDALSEALYLIHVERNGDVVSMTSYAPLFARQGAENWNPDLIYFNNERLFPTCSYYVQQMFGNSSGQYFYGDCVTIDSPDPTDGAGFLQEQSVVLNTAKRELYVKLCNASPNAKTATLDLSRFRSLKHTAVKTTLTGNSEDVNDCDSQPVTPTGKHIKVQKHMKLELPSYTFFMLTIKQ